MPHSLNKILIALAALAASGPLAGEELPREETLRTWIAEMKEAPRGPFSRIRWFCKDGTILPPEPYACKAHGGGSQHGERTEQVKALRENGYFIANVLADLDLDAFLSRPGHREELNQILIEQFLINVDDGWILRKARYYRGALQEESERRGARRVLYKLAEMSDWLKRDYVVLRTAARLLRHGAETSAVSEVRQLSSALAKQDADFQRLRNKIHVRPDATDAAAVRNYVETIGDDRPRGEYERLAELIDRVYSSASTIDALRRLAEETKAVGAVALIASRGAETLSAARSPEERLAVTASLLRALREAALAPNGPRERVLMLDTSLEVEDEHFAAATELRQSLASATRRERLAWLEAGLEAAYGTGLIGERQREALAARFEPLGQPRMDLASYRDHLGYLALLPAWGSQGLRFHFFESMSRLAAIEPLAALFIQDQLRGSPLFFYAQVLDDLVRDANRLAGVRNELFGVDVGAGLRALNPGLARGRLLFGAGADPSSYERDGIYLLPETVSELPPVAGILTAGEGNPLSHVQLLARNLGIPNVGVDERLIERLEPMRGKAVVLAVSPGGSVRLSEADEAFDRLFREEAPAEAGVLIRPDLDKLDLEARRLLRLSELRAEDSGRVVGPKAAKLGELKHHYPDAVADGLAIPFAVFRRLLERPIDASGRSAFEWMVSEYRRFESMAPDSPAREREVEAFRQRLHDWIANEDVGDEFRAALRTALAEVFGEDGSYGVFVRSDTNVEDLPGFTGAGLNLTVPNVVGVENILAAIPEVWASPFTARAFAWRQSRMESPEHVYPAVLLMLSVPAEKSGVLVTQDIASGDRDWLSVAVNEGVGGAVDGQAAESLRIHTPTGRVELLAQATAPIRRRIEPTGGVSKVPVSGADTVLERAEIERLIRLAEELPERFPPIVNEAGQPAPADIEFGFVDGRLQLFQIRPFLESAGARSSAYLSSLDSTGLDLSAISVDLNATPQVPSS